MFEIISAITSGLLGVFIGWMLRQPAKGKLQDSFPIPDEIANSVDYAQVVQSIWDLTHEVSADVDLHQDRVRAADDVLREAATGDNQSASWIPAISQILEANRDMQRQLNTAREKLNTQAEELQTVRQTATTDSLTHLKNRRAFDEHVESRFELRDQASHPTSLVLFDVDHFKQLNDTYGHQAGDQVLCRVASILYARLHDYGLAARYGGEEFAVIVDDFTVDQIAPAVEAVRYEISNRSIELDSERVKVTISCGLSQLAPEDSISQWIERADEAMYQAKHDGRNRGYINAEGQMIAIRNEDGPKKNDDRQFHLEAAELLKVGEQLHDSLTGREIPMTAVVLTIDGGEHAVNEVLRQARLRLRGIDRMGHLAASEIGIWMPSVRGSVARDWIEKFSSQCKNNKELTTSGCKTIHAGIATTESGVSFAQAVREAREKQAEI